MPDLFSPSRIGACEIPNRLVRSATYEGMGDSEDRVTDDLVAVYSKLAKGGVGLIISGYLYVDRIGKAAPHQVAVDDDSAIPGLARLSDEVHDQGGKLFFQINHAGTQVEPAVLAGSPVAPSGHVRDPQYFFKPKPLTEAEIEALIRAYAEAAVRCARAGADGVQIHAAHTYLINQFLSPFYNRRTDKWGGSPENRFHFLKEILLAVKAKVPDNFAVTVKLNLNDYTPKPGVEPGSAATYAGWLADLGVDAVELSAGSAQFAFLGMSRGGCGTSEFLRAMPVWKRPLAWFFLKSLEKKFPFQEAYNLNAARKIRPVMGDTPLILVGGMRSRKVMQKVLDEGTAQFISLSRPFLRQPDLANRLKEGKIEKAGCVSCNNCLAAAANKMPVRCYRNGLPT